jgi:Spy/CpxP family protein refolding chaperone
MKLIRTMLVLTLLVAGGASSLAAQTPQAAPAPAPADSLFAALFPPDLIMQHRRAIELTDRQRDEITRQISQLQGRVVALQWELLDEMEELRRILDATTVDMDRALDQMNAVLDREKEIKTAHLEMLLRIKNVLNAQQQAELRRLRATP